MIAAWRAAKASLFGVMTVFGDRPVAADYHAAMNCMRSTLLTGWGVVLVLLAGAVLGGCRSNPHGETPEQLVVQTRTFADIVRWRPLHKMYAFLKNEPGQAVEIQPGLENVRVTGYEVTEPLNEVAPLQPGKPWRWRQAAQIDYVLTDRQVVRQLYDLQVWESDDEGKTWYRTTPVPEFR